VLWIRTVIPLRARLSAIAIVASLLAAIGVPLLAEAIHPVCVAAHHDCAKIAKISKCCCADDGATRTDSTPAQPRVEARGDVATSTMPPGAVRFIPATQALIPVRTSPPRLCLLDLPTLFATFLI
jgi:hypothetical protein